MHYEKFADGTIKCIEDEIPFDIPEFWAWVRLNTCCAKEIKRGKAPKYILKSNTLVFAQKCNTKSGEIKLSLAQFLDEETLKKYTEDDFTQNNDIIINSTGTGTLGRVGIYTNKDNPSNLPIVPDSHITTVRVFGELNAKMVFLWLKFNQAYLEDQGEGSTNQKELRPNTLAEMLIPIPPLAEQLRIESSYNSIIYLMNYLDTKKLEVSKCVELTKSKILDLAIRGKLVPQDPNDEPASVLLERIKAEKEELIKQGRIKRDKAESTIFKGDDNSYYEKVGDDIKCIDCEIPFDLPHSWIWARLKTCCNTPIKRGKAPKYISKSNTLVFAQKCNTKSDDINLSLAQFLDESSLIKYSQADYLQHNDIVINSTGTGTLGRVGLYSENDNRQDFNVVPDSHISVVRITKELNAEIIYFWLKLKQPVLEHEGEGSTNQKELRSEYLSNILIPIPPFNEQRRIVDQIKTIIQKLKNIEESINN